MTNDERVALNGLKSIKKETMADLIIDQILHMIEEGAFVPGQKLPSEKEFAAIFSVSRPTIHEAMRSLVNMGIVNVRRGDGSYLNDSVKLMSEHLKTTHLLNRYSYSEVVDTRLALETQNAYLAAQNATQEDLDKLEEAYRKIEASLDYSVRDFHSTDLEFHLAIADCAKNRFMKEMLHAISDLTVMMNVSIPTGYEIRKQSIASSRRIVDAITSRNGELARQIMYEHIADTGDNIRKYSPMSNQPPVPAAAGTKQE